MERYWWLKCWSTRSVNRLVGNGQFSRIDKLGFLVLFLRLVIGVGGGRQAGRARRSMFMERIHFAENRRHISKVRFQPIGARGGGALFTNQEPLWSLASPKIMNDCYE